MCCYVLFILLIFYDNLKFDSFVTQFALHQMNIWEIQAAKLDDTEQENDRTSCLMPLVCSVSKKDIWVTAHWKSAKMSI